MEKEELKFKKDLEGCLSGNKHWGNVSSVSKRMVALGWNTRPPSVKGVEGIETVIRASRIYRYYLSDMVLRGATQEHKKSHLEGLVEALSPYLKDSGVEKTNIQMTKEILAIEKELREIKSKDSGVEWDEDKLEKCLTNPPINATPKSMAKYISMRFQPPSIIWPEEKEITKSMGWSEKFIAKIENKMLAACKAAHPVKEIECKHKTLHFEGKHLKSVVCECGEIWSKEIKYNGNQRIVKFLKKGKI